MNDLTELRLVIFFKDSAKIGSIKALLKVADTESNETCYIHAQDYCDNSLILAGFDQDKAIRRRVFHEINSRYHNMIEDMWEDEQ